MINNLWLLPCPHCGRSDTLALTNCHDLEACGDKCDEKEIHFSRYSWAVVCDFCKGGCGAAGGFRTTKAKAMEAWNERK